MARSDRRHVSAQGRPRPRGAIRRPCGRGGGHSEAADTRSNLLLVTGKSGGVLAIIGTASPRAADIVAHQPAIREALGGRESVSLLPQASGMLQLVTVPIAIYLSHPEMLGTLSAGFLARRRDCSAQLKAITGSDVAFGMDGQILATTLPREHLAALGSLMHETDEVTTSASATRYRCSRGAWRRVGRHRRIGSGTGGADSPISVPEQLAGTSQAIHAGLALTGDPCGAAVATLLSFAVARTIHARRWRRSPAAMREVAATAIWTRKIADCATASGGTTRMHGCWRPPSTP